MPRPTSSFYTVSEYEPSSPHFDVERLTMKLNCSLSRIVYSARAADVRHVVVDGRVVVRDGVLKTADLGEIRRAANTEARRLRRTVGI